MRRGGIAACAALLSAQLLAGAVPVAAQTAPASAASASDMPGMDHASMPGMPMETMSPPVATDAAKPTPAAPPMPAMDHAAMHGMPMAAPDAGMSGMSMGPMQGGRAPANARSGDYSDGIGYGPMRGMDMQDDAPHGMLLVDQLEAFDGRDASGQSWEAEGWYGGDRDKLWLRTEGERRRGRLDEGDIEALWSHALAAYWNTQLGLRHDLGAGPKRDWAAFGVQGLAPYWFEIEATGYLRQDGRTAARLRADYEVLFTQRLILQPELEVNLYGQSDAAQRIGSGLSDGQLGLRLRYEISRQFAPYIGLLWTHRYGATASFLREDRQRVSDRQWVAGIRFWF